MNQFLTRTIFTSLILILFTFCVEKKLPTEKSLSFELIRSAKIKLPQPSGLDLSFHKHAFWVVSDENSMVYKLDFNFNIIHSFKVNGIDLEGIAVVNENSLAVVLERSREIVLLDTLGSELKRVKIDLTGDVNSGLEGITYDSVNEVFYVINEKKPGLLIELDKDFNELKRTRLKIADDYSGIFYDKSKDVLWILSDESGKILITDKSGNLIEDYKTNLRQAEGICLDIENNKLFVVSDPDAEIFEFSIRKN